MAGGATIAQGFVFENEGAALLAVALGAGLVKTCHGQAARRFHDVMSVRIVTIDAVHFSLDDGVMLWVIKFSVNIEMAFETNLRLLTRINNEFAPSATSCDMFAGRSMTGLTTVYGGKFHIILREFPMST
jgi:hypothetical protein